MDNDKYAPGLDEIYCQYTARDEEAKKQTGYSLYSKFDIEQHKKHYVHYLEVIIDKYGNVHYANPSHELKAVELFCIENHIRPTDKNIERISGIIFDSHSGTEEITNTIFVWETTIRFHRINQAQYDALCKLREHNLLIYNLPSVEELKFCGVWN